MVKKNTKLLGIPDPPPYLGNFPKFYHFYERLPKEGGEGRGLIRAVPEGIHSFPQDTSHHANDKHALKTSMGANPVSHIIVNLPFFLLSSY